MADLKTDLREISVATTVGLLIKKIEFHHDDLHIPNKFLTYSKKVISSDISEIEKVAKYSIFPEELINIVDNGYNLGEKIFLNDNFSFNDSDIITWEGNLNKQNDPTDIIIGKYHFSLKEDSFILENMGLYKLINCYTGTKYKKNQKHIFKDYAFNEYNQWFKVTWNEMINILKKNNNCWKYYDTKKKKHSQISLSDEVILEFNQEKVSTSSKLPIQCSLSEFEKNTNKFTREQVFSKFINLELKNNEKYYNAKKNCAKVSTEELAKELWENFKYSSDLARFLRIHDKEYYYAKTTKRKQEIFRVPALASFQSEIELVSIESFVPESQANILTTFKNKKTGKTLTFRNECRFSHGQFNGTPEAKLYYERGNSLEVIYEKI